MTQRKRKLNKCAERWKERALDAEEELMAYIKGQREYWSSSSGVYQVGWGDGYRAGKRARGNSY